MSQNNSNLIFLFVLLYNVFITAAWLAAAVILVYTNHPGFGGCCVAGAFLSVGCASVGGKR